MARKRKQDDPLATLIKTVTKEKLDAFLDQQASYPHTSPVRQGHAPLHTR